MTLDFGLSGKGIGIGQVEAGRSGKTGYDKAVFSHPDVGPVDVFEAAEDGRVARSIKNSASIFVHATEVAGVMISTGQASPDAKGVAPQASLYSGANVFVSQPHAARVAQHITTQHGAEGGIRAINMSMGFGDTGNGNLLTRFVDWSASKQNILYVVAGPVDYEVSDFPQDNYNGITVGALSADSNGVFSKAWGKNLNVTVGGRRLTGMMAPGDGITVTDLGGGTSKKSGTSFAAPHVTGTVALLQEFAERQIKNNTPGWNAEARQHEVMKAVLLNSADKVKDAGDGKLLGMEKTITYAPEGKDLTWLDSDAAAAQHTTPYAPFIGVGALNANRALYQFKQGEFKPDKAIPYAGWDYNSVAKTGDTQKYQFGDKLIKDSYLAVTLAWDRGVLLNDWGADGQANTMDAGDGNGVFDLGESFAYEDLVNLDLLLFPKGEVAGLMPISASISTLYNVEELFFKIPETAEYEFWVRDTGGPNRAQNYAVAWRALAVPEPRTIYLIIFGFGTMLFARTRPRGHQSIPRAQ